MSTTDIYRLGNDPGEIGSVRNSWRSAMYVWNDLARRYLGMDGFPLFNREQQRKVWNAHNHANLQAHEIIVLLTTMDFAAVKGSDALAVADAFDRYGSEHPNSSFTEQAAILRAASFQPGDVIGWQQTSVSEFWGMRWNEDGDEYIWYNPLTEMKHFDAYDEAVRAALEGKQ